MFRANPQSMTSSVSDNRAFRLVGVAVLTAAAAAALGALLVRDQMSRHRRDLFSPHPLQRLAAIGYLARRPPSVDTILLLRDFLAWETRPLLRRRAAAVLNRLEQEMGAARSQVGAH